VMITVCITMILSSRLQKMNKKNFRCVVVQVVLDIFVHEQSYQVHT
jgi:hypothetical protein